MSKDATTAWKRERRQVFRRHHPDVGGDPEELLAALARVDAKYGKKSPDGTTPAGDDETDVVYVFSTEGPMSALRGWLLQLWFRLRDRAHRPTYFDI